MTTNGEDASAAVESTSLEKFQPRMREFLNTKDHGGHAAISYTFSDRVHYYDSKDKSVRTHAPSASLCISDCHKEIELDFETHSAAERVNSLYKVDTLIAVLQQFRADIENACSLGVIAQRNRALQKASGDDA